MRYRQLRDIAVSEIGLGCSGFWGNRRFPDAQAIRVVHEAFALGINYFDTGHNYCNYNAEPRLGRAIAEILATHDRSKLVISTKAGTLRRRSIIPKRGLKLTDHSPDYLEAACASALANLRTDYVDIFYLHAIPPQLITDELLTRLNQMRARGMFRFLGINTHSVPVMRHVANLKNVFDVALIDFNVAQLDRLPIIEELNRAGIAVMVGNVLAQGHLIAGKIGRLGGMADAYYLARATLNADSRRLAQVARCVRPTLASVGGMSAAQAAMAYALSIPQITSCIFGTTDVRNLVETAGASTKRLSTQDAASIRAAYESQFAPAAGMIREATT
jgi:aryl-alcohol dehydrogenase-like predicted oxidoreductase